MMSYVTTAGTLLRRSLDEGDGNIALNLPKWAWAVFLADAVVFLPILIFLGYTLGWVYPVLAMVEDPSPPAYEPVPLNEDAEPAAGENAPPSAAATPGPPKPITSSLRRINRLLYAIAGWRSSFRGIVCAIVIVIANSVVGGIFSKIPFVPRFVGTLLCSLALVQLNTAWVHIVISSPSKAPFYRRLLPFKKVFEATCFPVLIYWGAMVLADTGSRLLAMALGLPLWDPAKPGEFPKTDESAAWKSIVVVLVALAVTVFVVIPARIVLIRVQASLLPGEEDTIIPFDRSFGGKVEPAIVGGKGYVTVKDALKTFSRSSWIRVYVLYLKTFLVGVALYILMAAVVIPEIIVMSKKSTPA